MVKRAQTPAKKDRRRNCGGLRNNRLRARNYFGDAASCDLVIVVPLPGVVAGPWPLTAMLGGIHGFAAVGVQAVAVMGGDPALRSVNVLSAATAFAANAKVAKAMTDTPDESFIGSSRSAPDRHNIRRRV
jgi:hypothetical protein